MEHEIESSEQKQEREKSKNDENSSKLYSTQEKDTWAPHLKQCPYCQNPLYPNPHEPKITLDQAADMLESDSFVFVGFTGFATKEVAASRVESSEYYNCFRCNRSITLAYDQFVHQR